MNYDSKISSFLDSEKGKVWLRVVPEYFKKEFKSLARSILKQFLDDFAHHLNTK